jgi:hypothetical protein
VIEVRLHRLVLRTLLHNILLAFSLLCIYPQLTRSLLTVEPKAARCDHCWNYEGLRPIPGSYVVAVANSN